MSGRDVVASDVVAAFGLFARFVGGLSLNFLGVGFLLP